MDCGPARSVSTSLSGKKAPPGGFGALPSPLAKICIPNFTDIQECRERSEEKVRGMKTGLSVCLSVSLSLFESF